MGLSAYGRTVATSTVILAGVVVLLMFLPRFRERQPEPQPTEVHKRAEETPAPVLPAELLSLEEKALAGDVVAMTLIADLMSGSAVMKEDRQAALYWASKADAANSPLGASRMARLLDSTDSAKSNELWARAARLRQSQPIQGEDDSLPLPRGEQLFEYYADANCLQLPELGRVKCKFNDAPDHEELRKLWREIVESRYVHPAFAVEAAYFRAIALLRGPKSFGLKDAQIEWKPERDRRCALQILQELSGRGHESARLVLAGANQGKRREVASDGECVGFLVGSEPYDVRRIIEAKSMWQVSASLGKTSLRPWPDREFIVRALSVDNFREALRQEAEYARMAADRGHKKAAEELGYTLFFVQRLQGSRYASLLSFEGVVRENEEQSRRYLRIASPDSERAAALLGLLLARGLGGVQDFEEGMRLLVLASRRGDALGLAELARAYLDGKHGLTKSFDNAYLLAQLAIQQEHRRHPALSDMLRDSAAGVSDAASARIAPTQLGALQKRAKEWKLGLPLPLSSDEGGFSGGGSGFFVSHEGHFVTNEHVVKGCAKVALPVLDVKGSVLTVDASSDLALLKFETTPKGLLPIRERVVSSGEEVFVYGFPLKGILADGGNFSAGVVSSTVGMKNDSGRFQFSAQVQPGNSGGPVLDKKGSVVGIVESKITALRTQGGAVELPQNVNFAVKATLLASMLDAARAPYERDRFLAFPKDPERLSEVARDATYRVECIR